MLVFCVYGLYVSKKADLTGLIGVFGLLRGVKVHQNQILLAIDSLLGYNGANRRVIVWSQSPNVSNIIVCESENGGFCRSFSLLAKVM
jgi:hypothetical protein